MHLQIWSSLIQSRSQTGIHSRSCSLAGYKVQKCIRDVRILSLGGLEGGAPKIYRGVWEPAALQREVWGAGAPEEAPLKSAKFPAKAQPR